MKNENENGNLDETKVTPVKDNKYIKYDFEHNVQYKEFKEWKPILDNVFPDTLGEKERESIEYLCKFCEHITNFNKRTQESIEQYRSSYGFKIEMREDDPTLIDAIYVGVEPKTKMDKKNLHIMMFTVYEGFRNCVFYFIRHHYVNEENYIVTARSILDYNRRCQFSRCCYYAMALFEGGYLHQRDKETQQERIERGEVPQRDARRMFYKKKRVKSKSTFRKYTKKETKE